MTLYAIIVWEASLCRVSHRHSDVRGDSGAWLGKVKSSPGFKLEDPNPRAKKKQLTVWTASGAWSASI